VVKLTKITKVYLAGDVPVPALRGINLHIGEGEFLAIMGHSGSGKSTLLNILGCLDKPSGGTYELDGLTVSALDEEQLAVIRNQKIGFVFQSFNLLRRLPAVEQVVLPLLYRRVPHRRRLAVQALTDLGLADRLAHRPPQLSGGEQQRVAIARCLVTSPSLILADEPTGALDTATGHDIMHIFQRLNEERAITIVLVTHEREIADYAHRVVHIQDGQIVGDERNSSPNRPPTAGEPSLGGDGEGEVSRA
jgi:putative ABC transport system ATP-binding protein